MTREIKFRFWIRDSYNHPYKLVYPDHIRWHVLDLRTQTLMEGMGGEISECPMIAMQFTGLNAYNGDEIYEGDIISYTVGSYTTNRNSYISPVQFRCAGFHTDCHLLFQCDNIVILGNIHENPEFLTLK